MFPGSLFFLDIHCRFLTSFLLKFKISGLLLPFPFCIRKKKIKGMPFRPVILGENGSPVDAAAQPVFIHDAMRISYEAGFKSIATGQNSGENELCAILLSGETLRPWRMNRMNGLNAGKRSMFIFAEDERRVRASESERVCHGMDHLCFARHIGNIIEIATFGRIFEIDGRWQNIMINR